MSDTLFIRLLQHEDKSAALAERIAALREGRSHGDVYAVDPESFRQVPNTPFCYWVSERIRRLFKELPPFESEGRTVKVGLQTSDDFRFVRAWWEVPAERILDGCQWAVGSGQKDGEEKWTEERIREFQAWCRRRTWEGKRWVPFAKGGEYSPYYADIHLVVNWENEGAEIKQFIIQRYPYLDGKWEWVAKNTDYYFRPGLTWPERTTSGYCPQAMPAGLIFSVTGQAMILDDARFLESLLSTHTTRVYEYIEELMIGLGEESVSGSAARHYTGGTISRLPYPKDLLEEKLTELATVAHWIMESRRREQACDDASWAFTPIDLKGKSLLHIAKAEQNARLGEWAVHLESSAEAERIVRTYFGISEGGVSEITSVVGPHPVVDLPERNPEDILTELMQPLKKPVELLIDEAVESGLVSRSITKKSYFVSRFHELLAQQLGCSAKTIVKAHRLVGELPLGELDARIRKIISYIVGVAFGRYDVRIALDPSLAPKLPHPFDPLPVCPPGMLQGPDGLPAEPNRIVSEEWLRARPDANTLPPEGSVKNPTIPDSEYPLRINWDGVLVDDPGFNGDRPHRDDIVRRVREVFDLLWKDKSHEIEQEACDILAVSDLRDYFRKPAGFFQDHLKRYSKSRRKAPIYWPLSTASGSYTIWLYYHRLTDQTLYMVVNKYVEPKISEVERGIAHMENDLKAAFGREATRLTDRLAEARTFLGELRDLREELLRVAALPYKPDLNDGVILNAAPLHKLFRLRSWAKDTEECWKKLAAGDYDWAHLAYTIWPDRVREVCKHDRSIAIAHGLEDLCEVKAPAPEKRGGRARRKKEAVR